jgi:leader peptidase (prepilin peptidase)/N-methyltransferase
MFAALVAGLGALVGALTPRVAYRLSVAAGSPSRSACARCARPFPRGLRGWVRPGARCPACGTRTGPRPGPPALAGAGSFGLLAAVLGGDPALPALLIVAALGLPLAAVDLACLRLPDPLLAATAVAAAAGLTGAALAVGTPEPLLRALLAALACAAGYVLLALLPGARLGFGDVKLAGVLGLPLGWIGWPAVLLGLALPHVINGSVALVLLRSGRATRGTALPFGPAMLAGALIAVALVAG